MDIYKKALADAGLSDQQAAIYVLLVTHGPRQASAIARECGISRTLAYRVLDELVKLGLVEKVEKDDEVARFLPTHPVTLKDLADKRKEQAEREAVAIGSVVDNLVSEYNKVLKKPGVRFYEGRAGMKAILDDSLSAKEVVDTYVDIESVERYISDINKEYSKQREKLGIKKRGIVPDTPFNRKYLEGYHTQVTDTKFVTLDTPPFHTVMQMYDNKVSYATLRPESMIGVIIDDPFIYTMHKAIFAHVWNITPAMRPSESRMREKK